MVAEISQNLHAERHVVVHLISNEPNRIINVIIKFLNPIMDLVHVIQIGVLQEAAVVTIAGVMSLDGNKLVTDPVLRTVANVIVLFRQGVSRIIICIVNMVRKAGNNVKILAGAQIRHKEVDGAILMVVVVWNVMTNHPHIAPFLYNF
jgi:hypothetical protein